MTDLPPGLQDFGRRLEKAADSEMARGRSSRRRGRTRSILTATLAAIVAGGVAATAARLVEREGAPVLPDRGADGRFVPPLDPQVLVGTVQDDPLGGDPWALKAFSSASGDDCVLVGRLRAGVFGVVQGRLFRALPSDAPGLCGDVAADGLTAYLQRFDGRTAIFGLSASRSPITVRTSSRSFQRKPAAFGAYLVIAGIDGPPAATITTTVDGRSVTRRLR